MEFPSSEKYSGSENAFLSRYPDQLDLVWGGLLGRYGMKSSGQSIVEYLLLMMVVMVLSQAFFTSSRFKDYFGQNSTLFDAMSTAMEYSYRHGLPIESGAVDSSGYSNGQDHETYYNKNIPRSRFFDTPASYGQ